MFVLYMALFAEYGPPNDAGHHGWGGDAATTPTNNTNEEGKYWSTFVNKLLIMWPLFG